MIRICRLELILLRVKTRHFSQGNQEIIIHTKNLYFSKKPKRKNGSSNSNHLPIQPPPPTTKPHTQYSYSLLSPFPFPKPKPQTLLSPTCCPHQEREKSEGTEDRGHGVDVELADRPDLTPARDRGQRQRQREGGLRRT